MNYARVCACACACARACAFVSGMWRLGLSALFVDARKDANCSIPIITDHWGHDSRDSAKKFVKEPRQLKVCVMHASKVFLM